MSFRLEFESATGACPRCSGLTTLRVIDDASGLIGYVVSDWPWSEPIPDDPAEHPSHPHYLVDWFGQDCERRDIPGIRATTPHFIADAIHARHHSRSQAA